MNRYYIDFISNTLNLATWQVENTITLLQEGATVPFISRYRKEKSGDMDELEVFQVNHYYKYFKELEKRKESILKSIREQGELTEQLAKKIEESVESARLEDLYLPYKPKRSSRASIAKEHGLEPLANAILDGSIKEPTVEGANYLSEKFPSANDAVAGARDIIAERVSESAEVREVVRGFYLKGGRLVASKRATLSDEDAEISKFRNYFNFNSPIDRVPSHRVLALLRGVDNNELSIKIEVDSNRVESSIKKLFLDQLPPLREGSRVEVESAILDSYRRLLHPSIENESIRLAKERADQEAIKIFNQNLISLLLAPPVGEKRILAIDPGFRTGCKVVCLDTNGDLLHNETIYPHPPINERIKAMKKISNLVESYKIEVIAIGNGTAGRETENFIKKIALPSTIAIYSVNEDGASIYSASAIAREEFPNHDVTVRGAVSIGRRAMDPLAELVKIEPKSLGVGEYQHDVNQKALKEALDSIVELCVNRVGVNLNTASKHLLSYVSGIGPTLAERILLHRSGVGLFNSKSDLLNVSGFGAKRFEQCAGFLRVPNGRHPLDNSAVHPERYPLVEKIASDYNMTISQLIESKENQRAIELERYISPDTSRSTLEDILSEIAKPGLDPRKVAEVMEFSPQVHSIEELSEGMILPGVVNNITSFGAFIDIGVGEDGLAHISQLADRFVKEPTQILKLHQHVKVRVLEVDLKRKRIALSLRGVEQ
ncbi:MAG: Tex family protein [Bacteroidales bacterium]